MRKKLLFLFALLACAAVVLFFLLSKPKLYETQSSQIIMGSVASVKTYTGNGSDGEKLCVGTFEKLKALDLLISKNDKNAALYKINQNSGNKTEIDKELLDYINKTKEVYGLSDKKLAVTSGALTELWGFDTDSFRLPDENEIVLAIPLCNDETLITDSEKLTLETAEGQIINLGSVGKGIACDRAVEYLKNSRDCKAAVVSVGGSIGIFGSKGKDAKWAVGIRDPYGSENDYFAKLEFGGDDEIFVSTSGSYEKTFEQGGETYHHILDLTTGYPVKTPLVSVTVKADTGLLSDALSTFCFVMGEERSKQVLDKYSASAVYVYSDKTVSAYGEIGDALVIVNGDYSRK